MLSTLVFSITRKCIAECDFCGVKCSPKVNERLSLKLMTSVMDEVSMFGTTPSVVFTGGEPFLFRDDLLKAVQHAHKLGFGVRIVSCGYWASSVEKAFEILNEFKEAGLNEINFSVDDFHEEYVPLEYIKNGHDAAIKAKIPVLLAHKALTTSKITVEYLEKFFNHKFTIYDENKKNFRDSYLIRTSGIIPIGKNSDKAKANELDYCYYPLGYMYRCDSVLEDLVISARGTLQVCCGIPTNEIPELDFGSVEKHGVANLIKKADSDLIANWLVLEGPYGIKQYVESKDSSVKFKKKYINNCHLCWDIFTNPKARKIISAVDDTKIKEITYKRMMYDANRNNKKYLDKLLKEPVYT
jgi:organic radical activating enzyme